MEQIEPAYVTFEQGKKLKEKGFNVECRNYYLEKDKALHEGFEDEYWGDYRCRNWNADVIGIKPFQGFVSAPEQWQIVEWLRVNHGIHIEVSCDVYGELWYANLFVCSKEVWEDEDKRHNILTANRKFINEHKSKKEAYSAAFEHTLNKLI
jgi:hypothetical protein